MLTMPRIARFAWFVLLLSLLLLWTRSLPAKTEGATALSIVQTVSAPVLYAGPDVEVDEQPANVFAEPAIAASPHNPKQLIAASMSFGTHSWNGRVFASSDGGFTWLPSIAPSYYDDLGDVQVGYDGSGYPLFVALGAAPDPKIPGGVNHGLFVFGSLDDGRSWQRRSFLRRSYDHEQLLIDRASSRYHGRVYLWVLYSARVEPQENELGILHSDDGGRTFQGPAKVVDGWNFNSNLAEFNDGELFIPYIFTAGKPPHFSDVSSIRFVTSSDGGKSFSPPREVGRRYSGSEKELLARKARGDVTWDLDSVPRFAIDDTTDQKFSNRVYAVWSDLRFGSSRVLFTYSSDRGRTWQPAKLIAAESPARGSQYQPSIAVDNTGSIGISWFDSTSHVDGYDELFTESLDGGQTFLKPVRVSSATSMPKGAGNTSFTPAGSDLYRGSIYVFLTAPIGRFQSGGDYMGIAADSAGGFHPLWTDARTGIFQLRTAAIQLASAIHQPPVGMPQDVTSQLRLVFGRADWNPKSDVVTLRVRLKNLSQQPLFGPFVATISLVRLPDSVQSETATILNAQNHKSGIGATFVFSDQVLPPASLTQAEAWEIKVRPYAVQPTIAVKVKAYAPALK